MVRSLFRPLRRCRLLFALALCAWLGLAGAVWAHADACCTGMGGMAAATMLTHHHGGPTPLHADGVHADCACAHATATLPEPAAATAQARLVAMAWQAWPGTAPEFPRAPPLRPPLA